MSKLILKAIPANATSAGSDQTLGYIDTMGSTQRVSVKAQPKTVYRLVDAKTGEVIKNQTVLRQGKQLKVMVDGVNAVELDNFFPDEAANATAPVDSPSYLVDTGAAGAHSYGVVTSQTPVEVSANGLSVLWTPGMTALPVADPVAFGAPAVAAVSGVGSMGGMLGAVGVAAAAGGGGGVNSSGAGSKPIAKITGSAFKAEVADNTGLVVEAFDSTGKSRGKANVDANGKYELTLDDPAFKGSLVLKMYDGLPDDGKTPKFYDEATGEVKDFTKPLYAVVNYGGEGKTITVNVTPLTNLAATVAGVDTTTNKMTVPADKTADQVVKEANAKVAQKFGLNVDDLTAADVQTTKSDNVNAYGVALAVISKMEQGKSQDDVAKQFKENSSGFTQSIQDAVTALKSSAGSNNDYLRNIDTNKLDKVSTVASDTKAPVLVTTGTKANTSSDGTKVYLHFDSELSKNTAGVDAFTVSVTTKAIVDGGADTVSTSKISSVAIDGNDMVLTLATAIVKGQAVTVSYTDPTAGTDDLLAVQDVAGNDAANISATTVVNNVANTTPVITVKAGQSFSYDENQTTKASLGTVLKTDSSATPTKFRFTVGNSSVSSDGLYSIDTEGNISLTNVGLSAGKASNDYEINSGKDLKYGVQAGDDMGNWSTPVDIILKVKDVSLEAPTVSAPVSFTVTEDVAGNLVFDKAAFADQDSTNLTVKLSSTDGVITATTSGGVTVSGSGASLTFEGTKTDLNTFFSKEGNIKYTGAADVNGSRVLTIKVSDDSNPALSKTITSNIKITAVNDAPTGANATITIDEDSNKTFATADFGFTDASDTPANSLSAIIITNLPTAGSLKFNNVDVTKDQSIAVADLSKLVYTPAANGNGDSYASIGFKVQDNGGTANDGKNTSANANTLTINVTAVNDAPVRTAGSDITLNINEDSASTATSLGLSAYTYSAGGGADETSGNSAQTLSYKFTHIPSSITLWNGGTQVTTSTTGLTLAEMNGLTYKTVADANDSAAQNLTWTVTDSGTGTNSITETISVKVNAVNDAPSSADKIFTIMEDGSQTFTATDFGFTDASDTPANSLSAVIITSLPAAGSLKLNNVDVTKDQSIAVADLSKLVYTPTANGNGDSYATIGFKVQDNGGTANDGKNTSANANTLTINVTPVNDAPTLTATAANPSFTEGSGATQGEAVSVFSGANISTVEEGQRISSLTFTVSGLVDGEYEQISVDDATISLGSDNNGDTESIYYSVTLGEDGTATVVLTSTSEEGFHYYTSEQLINSIKYQNISVDNPTAGNRVFTLTRIQDSGGTDNSGVDTSTLNVVSTVKVVAVNDAPVNTVPASAVNVEANIATYNLDGEQVAYTSKAITGLSIDDADADADAGTNTMSVTLSVANGSLTHNTRSGVTFTDTSDSSFTASGSKTDLNKWLASTGGVTYTPTQGFKANDTLTMLTSDGGNTGDGGEKTDTDTVTLTVADKTAPTLLKAETDVVNGAIIRLTYSEDLDGTNIATNAAFALSVRNGSADDAAVVSGVLVNSVSVSGRVVTLNLSKAIEVQHKVKLTYTDADGNNTLQDVSSNDSVSFANQAVTIKVPDLVAPVVTANQSLFYDENQEADAVVATVLATDNVRVTDYRFADDNSEFETTTSSDGYFSIDANGRITITAQARSWGANNFEFDLAAGEVDAKTSFSYRIQARDAYGNWSDAETVTLIPKNVNEAPTLTSINSFSFDFMDGEDTFTEILYGDLLEFAQDESDVDANDTLKFLITGVTTGTLQKWTSGTWVNVTANTTTVAEGEKLQWKPAADANGSGLNAFTVKAMDAGGLTSATDIQVKANVAAVNDAPIVVSGKQTVTLTPAAMEDPIYTNGANVGSLFSDSFSDAKDAVSGGSSANTFKGIIITGNAATSAQGTWQWSYDGSDNDYAEWFYIPKDTDSDAPTAENVFYLRADAFVRFAPSRNFNGTPGALTTHLVESSYPEVDTYDNSNRFYPEAGYFTAEAVTLTTSVTPVNDAPTVVAYAVTLAAVDEDTASPAGAFVSNLFGGSFSDAKDTVTVAVSGGSLANTFAGVAIKGNAAVAATQGVWQWSTDGSSWTAIATSGLADGTALFLAATTKLRFVPANNYNGTPGALTARLVDSSASLTNGNTIDVSTNGGTTAYSNSTVSLGTSINAVNDAPIVIAPSTFTVNEDTTVNLLYTGTPFADIDSTHLSVTLSIADGTINATTGGNVSVAGTAIARTFMGRTADLNTFFTTAGNITYTGAQDANGTRTLTTSVSDGYLANVTPSTTTITINLVNDAPVASGSATLGAINEDNTSSAGSLVSALFGTNFNDSKDTVANGSSANTLAGVAIKGNAALATEGVWQWSTDGSSWTAIATSGLADGTALFLAATTKLRFVPANNYNGTPGALTARLVDSSASLTNGNTIDVSTNGGITAYSANSVNLGTSINAVNDAPTLTTTAANLTFTESTTATLANPVSVFGSTRISTVEAGQKIIGFQLTVTGVLDNAWEEIVIDSQHIGLTQTLSDYTTVGNGLTVHVSASGGTVTLSFSKAGGIDPALAESIINGMTYQHTHNSTPIAGDRVFTLTQIQDSGGTGNTGADTTTLNNVTSTVTVVASNDAPVITVPSGAIAGANSGVLYSLPGGYRVTDDDAGASQIQISFKVTETGQTIGDTLSYNTLPSGVNLVGGAPDANNVYTFKGRAFDLTNWMANAGFLKFTPTVGFNGTASIAISADDLGNTGNGGNQTATGTTLSVNVVSDSTPPALIPNGATTDNNGNIVLTYDDNLSSTGPNANMFSVFMNGSGTANNTVNNVTVSGRTVTLDLATKIRFGDTVQVSYTDGPVNDTNAIQDSVGNDAVSLVKQAVTNNVPNVAPTLTSFGAVVVTGNEDNEIPVTFANLVAQGNEADADGTVNAFVVKTVNSGTLKIGTSALAATAWVAGTNDVIDATRIAYWTPVLNANGTALDAFSVVAKDNGGVVSSTNVSAKVAVTSVNDAPTLTTGGAIATVNEDANNATAVSLWSTAPAYGVGGGDEAGQTLSYKITAIPSFIALFKADGTAVTANTTLTAAEFAGLKYKTVGNANGTGSVTFDVIDSGSGTAPNVNTLGSQSVSMTVTAVNDAPTLTTAGAIATVLEDANNATAVSLWSTAPAYGVGGGGEAGQTLSYKITAIPSFIALFKADGAAVTANTTLTAAEFAGLKYKTVGNANGTGSVTFDVIDSGSGTAPNVNTLVSQSVSMTVTAVNDVATGGPSFTGSAQVGSTLTGIQSTLADLDGIITGTITYTWQKSVDGVTWTEITTAPTYTPVTGDFNHLLRVQANYTNVGGRVENVIGATMAVVAGDAPYVKDVGIRSSYNEFTLIFSESINTNGSLDVSSTLVKLLDGVSRYSSDYNTVSNSNIYNLTDLASRWNFDSSTSEVKFVYTDPSGNNDTEKVIQDIAGTDAPSFIVYLASQLNTATTIDGTNGNDFLMGNQSAIQGDYMHRTITGGKGNDVMWAGAMPGINGATNHYPYGATYKWNVGDAGALGATDTIKDFRTSNVAGSPNLGDTLNFQGLLTGYAQGSMLTDWIKSVTTGQTVNGVANSSVMVIDIDGTGPGTVSQVVVLEGFDLLAGYSGNLATQLTALKNAGILVV